MSKTQTYALYTVTSDGLAIRYGNGLRHSPSEARDWRDMKTAATGRQHYVHPDLTHPPVLPDSSTLWGPGQ